MSDKHNKPKDETKNEIKPKGEIEKRCGSGFGSYCSSGSGSGFGSYGSSGSGSGFSSYGSSRSGSGYHSRSRSAERKISIEHTVVKPHQPVVVKPTIPNKPTEKWYF